MINYHARDLIKMSREELWAIPSGELHTVTFDDGTVIKSTRPRTQVSVYCWWPMVVWPDTPIRPYHHINRDVFTKSSFERLTERALFDAVDLYGEDVITSEIAAKHAKRMQNIIYNDFNDECEEWVPTLTGMDYVEVTHHPKIRAINEALRSVDFSNRTAMANLPAKLTKSYEEIKQLLFTEPDLQHVRLARAPRIGVTRLGPILQAVCARGYPTEINDRLYYFPILTGYAFGIRNLYDYITDTRGSAKALWYQKELLKDVEYNNRQEQLIAMYMYNLHRYDDCQSRRYIHIGVGKDLYPVLGTRQWLGDDESGNPKFHTITNKDVHLLNSTIFIRSPITCNHRDSAGVCGACFGALSWSVPRLTNIGFVSTNVLLAVLAQVVLSEKHENKAVTVEEFSLDDITSPYISVFPNGIDIGLNSSLQNLKVSIHMQKSELRNLSDIERMNDLSLLSVDKISRVTEVMFHIVDDVMGSEEYIPIPLTTGSRAASLTIPFLEYCKSVGYEHVDNKTIRFDMSSWDWDKPVWELPRKHAGVMDFMVRMERIMKMTGGHRSNRDENVNDPEVLSRILYDFQQVVEAKFQINLSHLAIVLRAMMVKSKEGGDYNLPSGNDHREFAGFDEVMYGRSLSAQLAFEYHGAVFQDPKSYLVKNRAQHPFDDIFVPKRVSNPLQ